MGSAQDLLSRLRLLRMDAAAYADKAEEYLAMATRGMSLQRATDTGGTGDCPLSANATRYSRARKASQDKSRRADEHWLQVEPCLHGADFDAASLIALYYNQALTWDEAKAKIKRSEAACQRMPREMVQMLDDML